MARKKKSGGALKAIVVVLLVIVIALGASFLFYTPPVDHAQKVYNIFKYKYLYTEIDSSWVDVEYVAMFYQTEDRGTGKGSALEMGVVILADKEEYCQVVVYKTTDKAKEEYKKAKEDNKNERIKVVRRNKAVIIGTQKAVAIYSILPL